MSFFLDRSLKNAMQPKKKSLTYLKNIYSHLGFSAVKIVFFASSLRFLVGKVVNHFLMQQFQTWLQIRMIWGASKSARPVKENLKGEIQVWVFFVSIPVDSHMQPSLTTTENSLFTNFLYGGLSILKLHLLENLLNLRANKPSTPNWNCRSKC